MLFFSARRLIRADGSIFRLATFDRRQWREPYKALLLLEHLLTHGPRSVALEFQKDRDVIQQMATFQHIDERGFDLDLLLFLHVILIQSLG